MKKLSIAAAAVLSLSIAAPVWACPGMEGHDEAPKTAEKAKDTKDAPKAKEADKAKEAPPAKAADKAKPGDKVSAK